MPETTLAALIHEYPDNEAPSYEHQHVTVRCYTRNKHSPSQHDTRANFSRGTVYLGRFHWLPKTQASNTLLAGLEGYERGNRLHSLYPNSLSPTPLLILLKLAVFRYHRQPTRRPSQ